MINEIIEDIIQKYLERGGQIEIVMHKGEPAISLVGFYKSNRLLLLPKNDGEDYVQSIARYDERETVRVWYDIVLINYHWWVESKDRFDGWADPDHVFLEDFKRHNLIEVETVEVIKPIRLDI